MNQKVGNAWEQVSLRAKLTTLSVALIGLLLVVSSLGTISLLKTYLQSNADNLLVSTAEALRDEDPRDVDLVVPVPDDLFLAMYNSGAPADLSTWSSGQREANPSKMWRLWARDCAKQSRNATMFVQRTVDFKTQPQTYFDTYSALPRVRLDCAFMPDEARP